MHPDGQLIVVIALALLALAVLWALLPFSVFGIKPLLRDILRELQALNRNLTHRPPDRPPSG